eukprot:6319826-Prymnesium_polylepis.1
MRSDRATKRIPRPKSDQRRVVKPDVAAPGGESGRFRVGEWAWAGQGRPPMMGLDARLSMDVVMEDFWTRSSGVYGKPIWLRYGVLQLMYDDDNDKLRRFTGVEVPGGNVAFTRTAAVYSESAITDADIAVEGPDETTEALRTACEAFLQRVGTCYLVEANLLGFANQDEQCVLSSALKWALADYSARFGEAPHQIVLHLDVNGSLALGDVAGGCAQPTR